MQKSISGILKKVSEAGRPADRVRVLQENDCTPLRMFLMMGLDKRVEWNLPDGVPPYTTPEHEVDQEGTLINETFTVRRISYGEGVERVFPVNSPRISKIDVETSGLARRAKLNYLRDLKGKSAMAVRVVDSTVTFPSHEVME